MRILYESAECVALDKPAGIAFHGRDEQEGFVEQVRRLMTEGSLPAWGSLYSVHRLDAVTSGILLLARSLEAARALGEAFAKRQVKKLYLALSQHKPSKKQGRIIGDMERSRRGAWKLLRTTESPAITRFLSQHVAEAQPPLRLFLLKPETGKTHQIRVAMKSLGSPILGDALYGGDGEMRTDEVSGGCVGVRTYLHAWRVEFDLFGASVSIVAEPMEGARFLQPAIQEKLVQWREHTIDSLFP